MGDSLERLGKNVLNHGLEVRRGNISGSIESTGSFAHLEALELSSTVSTTISGSFTAASSSLASRITTIDATDMTLTTASIAAITASISTINDNMTLATASIEAITASVATLSGTGGQQGLGITNAVTFASLVVDNFTLNGTELDLSSGDLTLDVDGDIELNADGGDVTVKDDGAVLLNVSATKISGSVTSTGSFGQLEAVKFSSDLNTTISGSFTAVSSSLASRLTSEEGEAEGSVISSSAQIATDISGSFTSTSSSLASRVTTNKSNMTLATASVAANESNMTLATASIAAITASISTLSGTGAQQGVGTTNAVTFATVDTGQGANELYDMDQNVLTTSSPTFAAATITGTLTATEVHTTFVSSSIAVSSGSNTFGDALDDHHSFTGSLSVSGSATVTGSATIEGTLTAATVDINGGAIDGATIGAASHTTIKGTTIDATTDFTIDGLVLTADTITNDATLTMDITDDMVIDVDGGNLDVKDAGVALLNISATDISGSATSTGSFCKLEGDGASITNIDVGTADSAPPFLKTGSMYAANADIQITGSLSVQGIISGSYSGLSVGQRFKHTQSTAASTWTITHNFDYQYVNVDIYDDNDQIIIPTTVTATDTNTLTITFNTVVAGVAIISTGGQAVDELGKNVIFNQSTAATNWRVTHSIGEQYPAVTVYDENDNVIIPERISAADSAHMDIIFSEPVSGNVNVSVGGGQLRNAITGSEQLSFDNFGDISGSASSTGSFGNVNIVEMSVPSVSDVSSSVSTRLTTNETNMTLATASIAALTASISRLNTEITTDDTDMTLATASIAAITASISTLKGNVGQELNTDSAVTFATVDTGQGANELYDMDQNVKTDSAVTFATVDTGQGANELYDMDQNVKTDSNVTFGDITSTGTITATEVHTTFVSSSITVSSGSNTFGDAADDTHQFTGSVYMSSSITADTGSFGRVEASTVQGTIVTAAQNSITSATSLASVGTVTTGVWNSTFGTTSGTQISGSFTTASSSLASRITSNDGDMTLATASIATNESNMTLATASIAAITASVAEMKEFTKAATISGSFTAVSSSLASRLTSEEAEAEGSVVSSSAQLSTEISGSFTSLSSSLAGRIATNETNVTSLNADIIALSIALG